jgi:hypothetical protein
MPASRPWRASCKRPAWTHALTLSAADVYVVMSREPFELAQGCPGCHGRRKAPRLETGRSFTEPLTDALWAALAAPARPVVRERFSLATYGALSLREGVGPDHSSAGPDGRPILSRAERLRAAVANHGSFALGRTWWMRSRSRKPCGIGRIACRLRPGRGTGRSSASCVRSAGVRGNLVPEAWLAALATEAGRRGSRRTPTWRASAACGRGTRW